MRSEINGQEFDKGSNADVGLELNSRSAGKSLLRPLVWTYIENG